MSSKIILTQCNNYNQFKLSPANRDLNECHIDRIEESISDTYMLDLYPIVASNDGIIIDGQNRFTVAKRLRIPFYCISGPEITIDDVAEANRNTRVYDDNDCLHVYAKHGISSYAWLDKFMKDYPKVKPGLAIKLLDDQSDRAGFRDGGFVIRRPGYAKVVAQYITELSEINPLISELVYKDAIANLALNPVYDHKRMVKKLEKHPTRIQKCSMVPEAMVMLSKIYNHSAPEGKRVELKVVSRAQSRNRFDVDFVPAPSEYKSEIRGIPSNRELHVECTMNHDVFKVDKRARPIQNYQIENMVKAISKKSLLRYYPIIVDRDMTIIDGQKRWIVAKQLNIPIHYIVASDMSLLMAVKAGSRSLSWRDHDYLKHFCEQGYPDYIYLRDLLNNNRNINIKMAYSFLGDVKSWFNAAHLFRTGFFRAVNREKVEKFIEYISLIDDYRTKIHSSFQSAFFDQMNNDEFDPLVMVRSVNKYIDDLWPFSDFDSCLERMNIIYNRSVNQSRRIVMRRQLRRK